MSVVFNNWYHVTSWTYGQWVRGDLRGWRARHHREHCEGDYKHRPDPDEHRKERALSYNSMNRDPVKIAHELRSVVLSALVKNLMDHEVEVVCAELDGVHLHLLGRFNQRDVRRKIGYAKQHATTNLKAHCSAVGIDLGLEKGEGIWGKRCGVKPIKDRNHQLTVCAYILNHEQEGATTWIKPDWEKKRAEVLKWAQSKKRMRRQ